MPLQAPQWSEFLKCPICENDFDVKVRLPISIKCGHTVCKTCLSISLQRGICPFDQTQLSHPINKLPINTAILLLVEQNQDIEKFRPSSLNNEVAQRYNLCMCKLENLATFLRPVNTGSSNNPTLLSRPMQRKLVSLINCQFMEDEGRSRAIKAARSLGERSVTELILQHQNPQQLSANLWAAVRARGCQFLGPAMQEEVLKLVLLALEDASALSRKVLVMFVVQRLEPHFPQASKTSIGHVVQLLYRASCFKVTKRDGDSSLMQLKEEFRTYEFLRREHDAQIVQIATEAGLRIAPDQWSSLLYGDTAHKSHMQSIIDKLQTPQSFVQSIQELVIALQRTGDPGHLSSLRVHLDKLASIEVVGEETNSDWNTLLESLTSCCLVVSGLIKFIANHVSKKHGYESENHQGGGTINRYKTSMCRDLAMHGSCPRGKNCTFAHSISEIETYRHKRSTVSGRQAFPRNSISSTLSENVASDESMASAQTQSQLPPIARVGPLPRDGGHQGQPQNVLVRQPIFDGQAIALQQGNDGPVVVPVVQQTSTVGQVPMQERGVQENVTTNEMSSRQSSVEDPDLSESSNRLLPGEMKPDMVVTGKTNLATKSLGALKNRKEQIKGHLEDMIGRDEMERLTLHSKELAATGKSAGALAVAIGVSSPQTVQSSSTWSIWTSKSVISLTPSTSSMSQSRASPITSPNTTATTHTTESEHYYTASLEDEMIPFEDTPQVSRFGPISRRGQSIMRPSKPQQSFAPIDDDTNPTPVVQHSKQMSSQIPPTASLILQNGGITTLQPVIVGSNGEIGYIAYPDSGMSSMMSGNSDPVVALQIQHQQLQQQHQQQQVLLEQATPHPAIDSVFAESEKMRKDLHVLQQKISNLNINKPPVKTKTAPAPIPTQTPQHDMPRAAHAHVPLHLELASELHLIEKTIRDREMEMQITNDCMNKYESPKGLDYGSYIAQGLYDPVAPRSGVSSSTTTMTFSRLAEGNLSSAYARPQTHSYMPHSSNYHQF